MTGMVYNIKKGNKGITLVEIVVSMLILAIIIVPLLSAFVAAGKANHTVRSNSYARIAGESIVESVKILGVEGTALEFYKDIDEEGGDAFLMAAECSGFGENIPEGGHPSVVETDGIHAFFAQDSGQYEYRITGIRQGTGVYDAILKIQRATYLNDYQYADLSAFASDKTALINPALQNSDYDYRALQYFKQLNEKHLYAKYVEQREIIESENGKKWSQYYEALDKYNEEIEKGNEAVKPALPDTKPIPEKEPPLADEYIKSNIRKTLDITIDEKMEDGENHFIINSTMTYECDNTSRQFAAAEDTIVKKYSGYCNNQKYADIRSLLVLYSPFAGVDALNLETVNIEKNTAGEIDAYIIVQSDSDEDFSGSALNVNVTTPAIDKIKLFSQARLAVTPATITHEQKLIHNMDGSDDTLYNIDVEVYEDGGTFGKLITSIKSTFVDR
ncbi:MAG: prepilin-type N-terminal cleavage/methylation domain-containing protein [Lachnospiraceae bacterium]|nr:prepilin-type N-terminal cleavage/methylation domain-containing protein [Lachnospiraceae bacterium]